MELSIVMTRYVRQRTEFSCGPVAILNVLKWSGEKVALNSKLYKRIYADCECNQHSTGSPIPCLRKAVTKHCNKLRTRWIKKIKKEDVVDNLKCGTIVLLIFDELGHRHCVVLVQDGRNVLAINYRSIEPYIKSQKETVTTLTKTHLHKMLSNKSGLWLINK